MAQLAIVHGGETITPAGRAGGLTVQIGTVIGTNLQQATDEIYTQLLRMTSRNGNLGLA